MLGIVAIISNSIATHHLFNLFEYQLSSFYKAIVSITVAPYVPHYFDVDMLEMLVIH